MNPSLMEQLQGWVDAGGLRALDLAFTRFIAEQTPDASDALLLAVALLSERNAHGHVCLDLQAALHHPEHLLSSMQDNTAASQPIRRALQEQLSRLTLEQWLNQLASSSAVEDCRGQSTSHTSRPLIMSSAPTTNGSRPMLYLRRYWQYERRIQAGIQQRLQQQQPLPHPLTGQLLEQLFPQPTQQTTSEPDWQKIACLLAARSGFAIITGGPGTGKTTTVVRLLALLQGLQLQQALPPLQIRLAAPTGKAAARLNESISGSVQKLQLNGGQAEEWRAAIPTEVSTLHRLLGSLPNTRHFRHHAANPLPADLVVVDEASMVDVEMLTRLLDALSPDTRLILLGDKDQLASVEAGSILGDLCQQADAGHYTPTTCQWIEQTCGEIIPASLQHPHGSSLHQATTMLRHSYRFDDYPGIGKLADEVNSGRADIQNIKQIFQQHQRPDLHQPEQVDQQHNLRLIQLPRQSDQPQPDLRELKQLLVQGYRPYLQCIRDQQPAAEASREALDEWAKAVFEQHRHFQLLTPVRRGLWGVEQLNQLVFQAIKDSDRSEAPLLPAGEPLWYAGRPVLVTRNDYSLKLMNGDIGICLEWPQELDQTTDEPPRKILRVAFPDGKGGIRWVLPSRLQGVETVFAMTVHKSQGSEFTHTALLLPDRPNPVLTRELLYTGITRSSKAFTLIYQQDDVLQQALSSQVERVSGLGDIGFAK